MLGGLANLELAPIVLDVSDELLESPKITKLRHGGDTNKLLSSYISTYINMIKVTPSVIALPDIERRNLFLRTQYVTWIDARLYGDFEFLRAQLVTLSSLDIPIDFVSFIITPETVPHIQKLRLEFPTMTIVGIGSLPVPGKVYKRIVTQYAKEATLAESVGATYFVCPAVLADFVKQTSHLKVIGYPVKETTDMNNLLTTLSWKDALYHGVDSFILSQSFTDRELDIIGDETLHEEMLRYWFANKVYRNLRTTFNKIDNFGPLAYDTPLLTKLTFSLARNVMARTPDVFDILPITDLDFPLCYSLKSWFDFFGKNVQVLPLTREGYRNGYVLVVTQVIDETINEIMQTVFSDPDKPSIKRKGCASLMNTIHNDEWQKHFMYNVVEYILDGTELNDMPETPYVKY